MARAPSATRQDLSIQTYQAKRDFTITTEPPAVAATLRASSSQDLVYVVQKHAARRLHWDFRLEHGGVLWSWAVPKGPSLDPAVKRLAVRTEDHPLAYAEFQGSIPSGEYGAGTVDTWDRGVWRPIADDPAAALDAGELKFVLEGQRLRGPFVLVRLKPRPDARAETWLLIKERDSPQQALPQGTQQHGDDRQPHATPLSAADAAPLAGAIRRPMPRKPLPQLATLADAPPVAGAWLSEVKFDGYRLLAARQQGGVRLFTRNGHDWTGRLPRIARAVADLPGGDLLLDGELVALRANGVSCFATLQAALAMGHDARLFLYVFDMLHQASWDLRPGRLIERKALLARLLLPVTGVLRYSDHQIGRTDEMQHHACRLGLEGLVCKQQDAPYRAGRGTSWLKLKCQSREEFVVVGYTLPASKRRRGIGALHLGYRDQAGAWQYAGAVGSGLSERMSTTLRAALEPLAVPIPPEAMTFAGEALDPALVWIRPERVAEVRFAGWSGAGRLRHGVFLALREDKAADAVVRALADPDAPRQPIVAAAAPSQIVPATAPGHPAGGSRHRRRFATTAGAEKVGAITLTHADRALWPGISKRDLAEYWLAVAQHALPAIAHRPLALVRCPEGVLGTHFFQKHARPGMQAEIIAGTANGAPYLAIERIDGLLACAQMAAIEVHSWGSTCAAPLCPERLVFDLDPGEGVAFAAVVQAAHDLRARLQTVGLESFCRTTGGKGLHVVVPIRPCVAWAPARAWCRRFAETMVADQPERFVARLSKQERRGRILVDWLRNGLGATAIASFSPRARAGALVATPITWREATVRLDPARFTVRSVPSRLRTRRSNPWAGFAETNQALAA